MKAGRLVAVVNSHIVHRERPRARRRLNGRGAPVHLVGEAPADGHVEDDEVRGVDGLVPSRGVVHQGLGHLPVQRIVQVPPNGLLGRVGAVDLERISVEVALERRPVGHRVPTQPVGLVAGAARVDTAVHGAVDLVQGVDVLHDVELSGLGPVALGQEVSLCRQARWEKHLRVGAPEGGSQSPKCRPVTDTVLAESGQRQARLDSHLAALCAREVRPDGLYLGRSPRTGAVLARRDTQRAIARQSQVLGAGSVLYHSGLSIRVHVNATAWESYRLDLIGAPVGRSAGVRCPRDDVPVRCVGQTVGRADEVITPCGGEARDAGHGGAGERHQTGCRHEGERALEGGGHLEGMYMKVARD